MVSKKVNKSAVARNRMRRRIYEVFRTMDWADKPYDLVITVFQPTVEDMPVIELQKEVTSLVRQAKLD